jgi:hypothetical protein
MVAGPILEITAHAVLTYFISLCSMNYLLDRMTGKGTTLPITFTFVTRCGTDLQSTMCHMWIGVSPEWITGHPRASRQTRPVPVTVGGGR